MAPCGNIFLKYIRKLFETRLTAVQSQVDALKQSNVDLINLLTSKEYLKLGTGSTSTNSLVADKESYAGKVRQDSKIMIKPKVSQKILQTKSDILNSVDLVKENISVMDSRKVHDGGLVVACSSQKESSKLKNIVSEKLSKDYDVFVLRRSLPKIRLVGIPRCINKDNLNNYLKTQNAEVFGSGSECRVLHFWPTRKNTDILQATIQVDLATYRKSLEAKSVLIGLNWCQVYDDMTAVRCYKCNGFNHTKTKCRGSLTCPLCSGDHEMKSCTSSERKCSNCLALRNVHGFDISTDHSVFDQGKCFSVKFADAKLRHATFGEPVDLEFKKIDNFKHTLQNQKN